MAIINYRVDDLRALSALHTSGSFVRAAERLHITQSALSRSIQALEHSAPQGMPALRSAIADYLNLERGAQATADRVLILTSSQQALTLCATVLLDAMKAVIPILVARAFWPGTEGIAGVAAVAGHCFTPWLAFKGGKGFASAAGALPSARGSTKCLSSSAS